MEDCFLGVDIGGTKVSISLGTGEGSIKDRIKFPTAKDPKDNIDLITEAGHRLIESNHSSIKAIGISCGGPLDSKAGIILSPPHLPGWNHLPITAILQKTFCVPVFLQNDANACCLAEWNWGNGKGLQNVIFITFGTGFGAGLILNGQLYEGTSGMAGEIGHVRISENGPYCYGKQGSIESFCSGAGLNLLFKQMFGRDKTAKEICDLANAGDKEALAIINESAKKLGSALSILIDLLNPECITIGSIYTKEIKLFEPIAIKVINEETISYASSVCKICPSALGDEIGDFAALGVAKSFYSKSIS